MLNNVDLNSDEYFVFGKKEDTKYHVVRIGIKEYRTSPNLKKAAAEAYEIGFQYGCILYRKSERLNDVEHHIIVMPFDNRKEVLNDIYHNGVVDGYIFGRAEA